MLSSTLRGLTRPRRLPSHSNNVNEAPLNTVPGDQATLQDQSLEFSSTNGNAISVGDVDAGTNEIEVTLSVDSGKLSLDPVTMIGSETLVNTSTTATQSEPDVAYAADGSYVVVWQDANALDGDGWGVYGQRFDANGNKVGGEFLVNTSTANNQYDPKIAMDDAGNFVVTWVHRTNGGSTEIHAQRFDASGAKVGSDFTVNTTSQFNQKMGDIAMNASGAFVISWYDNGPGDDEGVFFQLYDAAGNEIGGETRANTTIAEFQQFPGVSIDDAGNFVVVWQSDLQDGSGYGIYGQRYDSAGNAVGGEF